MSHYTFTAEDRARAAEVRAANKAEKAAAAAPAFQVTSDNMDSVGYELLSQLYALAMTADDEGTRVRAASRALAHLLPSLRSVEFELNSLDPINVNSLEVEKNAARHGAVDPASWSTSAGDSSPAGDRPEIPLPASDRPPLPKLKPGVLIE